jgi:hypothetical protein
MSTCRFSDSISVGVRVSPCAPRPISIRDGAPSFRANPAAGPLPAAAVEPLLELPELEPDEELLLELLPPELLLELELLVELELLPPELPLEPADLLNERLLGAALSLVAAEPPPHPANTAVATQAATIAVFLKQRFARPTNVSTGMITLCPNGESIASRRDSATSQNEEDSRRMKKTVAE